MEKMTPPPADDMQHLISVLDQITEPMKDVLRKGNDAEVASGAGTWFKLKKLGLLDDNFNLTKLGWEVAIVIR